MNTKILTQEFITEDDIETTTDVAIYLVFHCGALAHKFLGIMLNEYEIRRKEPNSKLSPYGGKDMRAPSRKNEHLFLEETISLQLEEVKTAKIVLAALIKKGHTEFGPLYERVESEIFFWWGKDPIKRASQAFMDADEAHEAHKERVKNNKNLVEEILCPEDQLYRLLDG